MNNLTLPRELLDAIQDFDGRKAWGQIQIDFQRGRIVLVRKNETITTRESKLNQENNNRVYSNNNQTNR